jgi:hypothetical protein
VALYSLFVKRVRKNVHMALCMSPLSSEVRARVWVRVRLMVLVRVRVRG